jgi:hypothetical protein
VRPEGLGKLVKIIHLIGSRTHDLPVCKSALATMLPRAPPYLDSLWSLMQIRKKLHAILLMGRVGSGRVGSGRVGSGREIATFPLQHSHPCSRVPRGLRAHFSFMRRFERCNSPFNPQPLTH